MKLCAFSLASLLVLTLRAGEAVSPSTPSFSNEQIIESWGWMVAHEQNVAQVELNANELAAFLRGATANAEGKPAPAELGKIYADVDQLSEARHVKIRLAVEQKNLAAAREFFTALEKKPEVVALPSGLRYEITKTGAGSFPKPQQTISVHYTGRQIDGTEFTQMGPYDVVLVPNRMNTGLFEGAQKISRGGAIRIYVPAPLPKDEDVRLGIPPGSAAVYDLELLEIKETSPEELENSLLPPAPEPPSPPPSGFSERVIIETWGWIVARKTRIASFGFDEGARAAWVKGVAAGIRGEPLIDELERIRPLVERFVADQRGKVRTATRQKRLDEMEKLFAMLKSNPNVVELPDGLRYEIVNSGTGSHPKTGEITIVDYTGRLADGAVFDHTDNEPLHVEVGSIIAGWNEGIQKIGKGGRIKLYVPPALGYGHEDMSGVISKIPADSVLLYDIHLLDIRPAVTDEAALPTAKK